MTIWIFLHVTQLEPSELELHDHSHDPQEQQQPDPRLLSYDDYMSQRLKMHTWSNRKDGKLRFSSYQQQQLEEGIEEEGEEEESERGFGGIFQFIQKWNPWADN